MLDLLNSVYDSVESRKRLFDEFDKLQAYVPILKNGRPIKTLGGLETELEDGDEVAILPSRLPADSDSCCGWRKERSMFIIGAVQYICLVLGELTGK